MQCLHKVFDHKYSKQDSICASTAHAKNSMHLRRCSAKQWRFKKWHVSWVMDFKDCVFVLSCRLVAEKTTEGGRISRHPSHQDLQKYEQQREGGCNVCLPQVVNTLSWPRICSLQNHKFYTRWEECWCALMSQAWAWTLLGLYWECLLVWVFIHWLADKWRILKKVPFILHNRETAVSVWILTLFWSDSLVCQTQFSHIINLNTSFQ